VILVGIPFGDKGEEEGLHEEDEESRCHVVALPYSDRVRYVTFLFFQLEMELKIVMETHYHLDERGGGAELCKKLEQELMVGGVKCLDKIQKQGIGVLLVFFAELKGRPEHK
jgi:hypothetical protein